MAKSQSELSAFTATGRGGVATTFVTDYQAIGINPANLGFSKSFRDPKLVVGLMEYNIGFGSSAIGRADLLRNLYPRTARNIHFSYEKKAQAARDFANASSFVSVDAMLLGVFYRLPKNSGGIAFSIRDRMQVFVRMNPIMSEISFLGYHASYFNRLLLADGTEVINRPDLPVEVRNKVVKGFSDTGMNYSTMLDKSRLSGMWFREFNLAYGKKIVDTYNLSVHAGIGVKFLMGFALFDLMAENGEFTHRNIALSPTFGLVVGDPVKRVGPTFKGVQVGKSQFRKVFFPTPIGQGVGLDLGLNLTIRRHTYIGLAITNAGSIRWKGNVSTLTEGTIYRFESDGFDNYNPIANGATLEFIGTKSPLLWAGDAAQNLALPSMFRAGISYEYFRTLHFGLDFLMPLNRAAGNIDKPLLGVGVDWTVSRIIRLSTGTSLGGNQQERINLPFGITFIERHGYYEAGIATRDLTSYVGSIGKGSNLSLAFGFLRVKL